MGRSTLPLLFVFLITGIPKGVEAQDLEFGVRGGLTQATASLEAEEGFDENVGYRTGFQIGIIGSVGIAKNFAVQTEVLYSQKGFGENDANTRLSLDYVEIPVLAVIKLPARISPHLYLGVVLGLETGCKVSTAEVSDVDCEATIAENLGTPRTKGADSGVLFGGGVTLAAGPGSLLIDALYNYGLTNISEPGTDVSKIETRTLNVSAAYTFSIGGSREY